MASRGDVMYGLTIGAEEVLKTEQQFHPYHVFVVKTPKCEVHYCNYSMTSYIVMFCLGTVSNSNSKQGKVPDWHACRAVIVSIGHSIEV